MRCRATCGGLDPIETGSRRTGLLAVRPNNEDLAAVAGLAAEGKLQCIIDRRYPLSETAEAVGYHAAGFARGKVVITM